MKFASDWLSVFSLMISVILTISIFCISDKISKQNQVSEERQYTIVWANDLFFKIDQAVAKKISVEKTNDKGLVPTQNLKYISSDREIESLVFLILNQYSALGRALDQGLVNIDDVKALRQNPIIQTWNFYKLYISEYRDTYSDAWADFEKLYIEMTKK